jgi:peptide/nickel transport system substrate-binding protein
MKFLKTYTKALAALAAGTVLATGASAADLTIGVRSGAESMDPHFSAIGINVSAMKNVYETLTARDDNLQLAPGLAESWELVDELTWRFNLRSGVKFHDGSDLDAADVVQSVNRIPLAAGPDGGLVTYTRRIVEATAVDDLTVEFKTDSPAATLPLDLTRLFVLPSEVAIDTPVSEFNSGAAAIGTGPYKLISWKAKGDRVVEPSADYWGEAALLGRGCKVGHCHLLGDIERQRPRRSASFWSRRHDQLRPADRCRPDP